MARQQDITPQTQHISSTPEEAVANIKGAAAFDISPVAFKEKKSSLQPMLDQMSRTPVATPVVAKNIAKSPEHAAALTPDANSLSWIEDKFNKFKSFIDRTTSKLDDQAQVEKGQVEYVQKHIDATKSAVKNRLGPQKELSNLGFKRLTQRDSFTEEDEFQLASLKIAAKENFGEPQSDLGFYESLPATVIAEGANMAHSMWRNKELVAGITAVQTGIGAAGGSAFPVIGTGAGAGVGFLAGLGTSAKVAMALDNYKDTAGSLYNELSDAVDANGKALNIDESNKQYLSHGVGVISGAVEFVGNAAVMKRIPLLKKFLNPKNVAELISSPASQGFKQSLITIGKVMASNAGEEVSQEVLQIIGEEIGQTYENGDVGFMDGLARAADKIAEDPKTRKRLKETAVVGAATSGSLAVASNGVGKVVDKVMPPKAPPPSDILDAPTPENAAVEVLTFQDLVDESAKVVEQTKIGKLDPKQAIEVTAEIAKDSGFTEVWFDHDKLPDNLKEVIDPSTAAAPNAPIRMDMKQFLELKAQYPEISEHAQLRSAAPSPLDAKTWWENKKKADEKRAAIKSRLEIGEKSPEERAYNDVKISPEMSDQEIAEALGSKEVANAYLGRLDVNEMVESNARPELPSKPFTKAFTAKNGKQYRVVVNPSEETRANGAPFKQFLVDVVDESGKTVADAAFHNVSDTSDRDFSGHSPDPDTFVSSMTSVAPVAVAGEDLKRIGLATAMYDALEEAGVRIAPSQKLTDEAAAFWQNRKSKLKPNEKTQGIQALRDRVTALRDSLPDEVTAKQILEQAAQTPDPSNDIMNEQDYLQQADEIAKVLGDPADSKLAASVQEARTAKVKAMRQGNIEERSKLVDIVTEQAIETQYEIEAERIANDPNVAVVDRFVNGKNRSLYAINPDSLTDTQKKRYGSSEILKGHKPFAKKGTGLSPDEAAALVGVNSGENLLKILASTPTRQAQIRMNVEKRRAALRAQAEQSLDTEQNDLDAGYARVSKSYLAIMKYLKDKDWSSAKKVIKKVALGLPKLPEIKRHARKAIAQVKVGQLDANQFKRGERKSFRIAMDAVLDGDILKAFDNLKNATLNNELAGEAHKAFTKVNKVIKLAKKFDSKAVQQELRDAGKLYENAANELLELFNLRKTAKRTLEEIGDFRKWNKEMIQAGETNQTIPERLSSLKENLEDMTVEEVLVIGDRLQTILHQARMKNKLIKKFGDEDRRTREEVIVNIVHKLQQHPERDETRSTPKVAGQRSLGERLVKSWEAGSAMLKNIEHIATRLGNEVIGNDIANEIIPVLYGDGKYSDQGLAGKIRDVKWVSEKLKGIIAEFNKDGAKKGLLDEWNRLRIETVDVPEWANNKILGNGKVTKADLLMMMMNMGNEGNLDRLANNMGTDLDTIRAVLDQHLDEKHADVVQKIFDLFDSEEIRGRAFALEERRTGVMPERVEAMEWTHKGKTRKGGYFPIMYQSEMNYEKLRKRNREAYESLDEQKEKRMQGGFWASDMTRHNHLENRVGSDQPLSLDMNVIDVSLEMVLHDLNFREPIAHVLSIITHKDVAKEIANIIGDSGYNVLTNGVIDAANSVQMQNNALFSSDQWWRRALANIRSGTAAGHLIGNVWSIAKQVASAPMAMRRLGYKNSAKHFGQIGKALLDDPTQIPEMLKLASRLSPSVKSSLEGYDENTRGAVQELLPVKAGSLATGNVKAANAFVINKGFQPFMYADVVQKAMFVVAGYKAFLAGDVEGFDYKTVQDMDVEEREHRASAYAASMIRQTLTAGTQLDKSYVQKEMPTLAMFMNDRRNTFNNILWMGRDVKKKVKAGQYGLAAESAIASWITLYTVMAIMDSLTEMQLGVEKDEDESLITSAWKKPLSLFTSSIPIVADIQFAFESDEMFGRPGKAPTQPASVAQSALINAKNALSAGMRFMDDMTLDFELKRADVKSILMVASYSTGGIPVKGMFELYDAMGNLPSAAEKFAPTSLVSAFKERREQFVQQVEQMPEADRPTPEHMRALEELEQALENETEEQALIDYKPVMERFKQLESGGNVFARKPLIDSAGVYQLTSEQWKHISESAPELGLTEGGRVSSDTEQQDKAMAWLLEENSTVLSLEKVEPTVENLYAAHILGASKAVEVLKSQDKMKIKLLIPENVLQANGIKANMKVKDFKNWLSDKVGTVQVAAQ